MTYYYIKEKKSVCKGKIIIRLTHFQNNIVVHRLDSRLDPWKPYLNLAFLLNMKSSLLSTFVHRRGEYDDCRAHSGVKTVTTRQYHAGCKLI